MSNWTKTSPKSLSEKESEESPELEEAKREVDYEKRHDFAERRSESWRRRATRLIQEIRSGRVRMTASFRELRYAYIVEGLDPHQMEKRFDLPNRYIWALATKYHWAKVKKELDDKLMAAAAKGLQPKLEAVVALGVHATSQFLTNLINSGEAKNLSPKDAKMISDVTANHHRVLQLAKGEPTDIVRHTRDMSNEELTEAAIHLMRALKEDPLCDDRLIDVTPPKELPAPKIEVTVSPMPEKVTGTDE